MKPRVTVCLRPDGTFELLLNEAGRDLMVRELQNLNREWDHFHLDGEPELATDVPLLAAAYNDDDQVLRHGKVLLRPDDWDWRYYPHVMAAEGAADAEPRGGAVGGPVRRGVETVYRGKRVVGEWWVEDGELHVSSMLGDKHWSAGRLAAVGTLPSEAAVGLLWEVARAADPKRPFFYWR
jgi:hypothetical protein